MSVAPERKRNLGFTLVELLVVIGIIAVLMGILLPTLSRARESAKRTECLSNMRSIYQMIKIYEIANKGASPLGYGGLEMQANYFLSRGGSAVPSIQGTSVRYVGLGLLFPAGIVKDGVGRVFYCPSFQGDINHDYSAPGNPWPPGSTFYDGATVAAHGCRMSYSQRPIFTYLQDPTGARLVTKVQFDKDTPNWPPQLVPRWWPSGPSTASMPRPYQFPKLAKLKGAAIFSDINSGEGRLIVGHKRGLNVLFNSGGAKFVDINTRFRFDATRNQTIKELIAAQTGYGTPHDAQQIQLWMLLDMQ